MNVQRTGPGGAALTVGAPNIAKVLAELLPRTVNDSAAILSLNNNSFAQKVEKHISDYRSGRGYLSSDIGAQISAKGESLASKLDTKSLTNFTAYATGLRYDLKARYVNNLSDSLSHLKSIVA